MVIQTRVVLPEPKTTAPLPHPPTRLILPCKYKSTAPHSSAGTIADATVSPLQDSCIQMGSGVSYFVLVFSSRRTKTAHTQCPLTANSQEKGESKWIQTWANPPTGRALDHGARPALKAGGTKRRQLPVHVAHCQKVPISTATAMTTRAQRPPPKHRSVINNIFPFAIHAPSLRINPPLRQRELHGYDGGPALHGYDGGPALHGYDGGPALHGYVGRPALHGHVGGPAHCPYTLRLAYTSPVTRRPYTSPVTRRLLRQLG